MMRALTTAIAATVMLVCATSTATAQGDTRGEHLEFAGWTGAALDGQIVGREFDRFQLDAVAGDTLTVRLHTTHPATYFNVYAPGRGPGDEALAIGGTVGGPMVDLNEFTGTLPDTGVYQVVVYMMRAAARRNETAGYAIEFDLLQPADASDPQAAARFFQVRTRAAGGHLNVHTGPSQDAARVGRYDNGAILRDIGGCLPNDGRDWCEVMAFDGGLAGYVARDFLSPVAPRRAGSAVAAPRHGAFGSQPQATVSSAGVMSSSTSFHVHLADPRGHLNVHAEPSERSVRVGRLPDGATVRNIGGCVANTGRTWCDVMLEGGGVSGWVASEYLRDGPLPRSLVTTPTGAPLPVTEDFADGMAGGPDFWRVDLVGAGSALRVHDRPSERAAVIARLHDGATLRNAGGCRMGEGRRWCYVSSVSGALTGWVAGDFIVEGAAPVAASHIPAPMRMEPAEDPRATQRPAVAYDMTGTIVCYPDRDAARAGCGYGTVHEGSGNGLLRITDGIHAGRTIGFEDGAPVYVEREAADSDITMAITRDGDLWIVFVGDARYEIPTTLFTAAGPGAGDVMSFAPEALEAEHDALVSGTAFNATAQVSCTRDRDATEALCDAGVIRAGDGSGEIRISWPDGGGRVLFFENNVPVSYNQSEADGGAEMTVSRDENGDVVVFVGEARFAFPEAFMTGG